MTQSLLPNRLALWSRLICAHVHDVSDDVHLCNLSPPVSPSLPLSLCAGCVLHPCGHRCARYFFAAARACECGLDLAKAVSISTPHRFDDSALVWAGLFMYFGADNILRTMGANAEIFPLAKAFLLIRAVSAPAELWLLVMPSTTLGLV